METNGWYYQDEVIYYYEGFKKIIKNEWNKISLQNIKKLYKLYPDKLRQIIARKDGMLDY